MLNKTSSGEEGYGFKWPHGRNAKQDASLSDNIFDFPLYISSILFRLSRKVSRSQLRNVLMEDTSREGDSIRFEKVNNTDLGEMTLEKLPPLPY